MTDDHQTCVRGCTRRGELLPTGERAEIPAEARVGLLCQRCADRLQQWITDIPDLYATLPIRRTRTAGSAGSVKRSRRSHSPALADLDTVALTDPRTTTSWIADPRHNPDDDPDDPARYVPDIIGQWARLLVEEQRLSGDYNTLPAAAAMLLRWWSTVCAQPWIDEMHDEIRGVYRILKRHHGDDRPQRIGVCISIIGEPGSLHECGAELYARQGDPVRCNQCGRRYDGLALLRIAERREQVEGRVG